MAGEETEIRLPKKWNFGRSVLRGEGVDCHIVTWLTVAGEETEIRSPKKWNLAGVSLYMDGGGGDKIKWLTWGTGRNPNPLA